MTATASPRSADPVPLAPLVDALERFEALLDAEHDALRARDMTRIADLTGAKDAAVEELTRLQQRHGLAEPAALVSWPEPDRGRLSELLERCRRKNQINGAVAEAGVGVNRTLIDILTGRSGGGDRTTYGGDGRVAAGDAQGSALTRV